MLFRFYRALMPQEPMFVDAFTRHSVKMVEAAKAFEAMVTGGPADFAASYGTVCRLEDEADTITKETILAIRRVFVTPFDRSDIRDLINGLDDVIDLMKDAGRRSSNYGVGFTDEMKGMARCITRATERLAYGIPLLCDLAKNAEELHSVCAEVGAIESEADELMALGLRTTFKGNESPGFKMTVERVYDLIEEIVDRCEDVADCIDGIVAESV